MRVTVHSQVAMGAERKHVWVPVASDNIAETVRRNIVDIADYLRGILELGSREYEKAKDVEGPLAHPTMGGYAGIALFFHYLSLADLYPLAHSLKEIALSLTLKNANEASAGPGLLSGFTGPAWLLEHCKSDSVTDTEDPVAEVEIALLDFIQSTPGYIEIDLVSGVCGNAVFAVERFPRPAAIRCLTSIVKRLADSAIVTDKGTVWETAAAGNYKRPRYDFGVAHGLPGIVQILAQAHRLGIEKDITMKLAQGAVQFLSGYSQKGVSAFPSFAMRGVPLETSRLAWCYGDTGLAGAFLVAGDCLGDEDLITLGIRVAEVAAHRRDNEARVIDETVCHGSAGLVHFFSRMFNRTNREIFAEMSNFWLEKTLEFREAPRGFVGLGGVWKLSHNGWARYPGLLMGAAGVGLSLLGTVTTIEPAWDRLLLMSSTALDVVPS